MLKYKDKNSKDKDFVSLSDIIFRVKYDLEFREKMKPWIKYDFNKDLIIIIGSIKSNINIINGINEKRSYWKIKAVERLVKLLKN